MRPGSVIAAAVCVLGACSSSPKRDDGGVTPDRPRYEAGRPPGCGNGKLDPDESCDGEELDGQTCVSLGYLGGSLACHENCRFDESGCSRCGDGVLQKGEDCDSAELGGATCVSLGFTGGTLACKQTCEHDTTRCTSSAPGEATVVYGSATAVVAQRMDTATGSWSKQTLANEAGTRWAVSHTSPSDPSRAVAAVAVQLIGGVDLLLFHDDGKAWVQNATIPINALDPSFRAFDVVYQDKSGVPLLVYSNGTSNPMFRTFDGTSWSTEQTVFLKPPGTTPVRWVKLAVRPRTDEVALVYSDEKTLLHAVIWDGKSFREAETKATLASEAMGYKGRSFDAVYEDQSGDLLVVNGDDCCSCFGYYWRKPDKWTSPGNEPYIWEGGGPCGRWKLQRLAALRGSDAVALAGDEATAVIWGGAAFYGGTITWPGPMIHDNRTIWADVAWVGSQPTAVLVHRGWTDSTMPEGRGRLHWLRSQPGGAWLRGKPHVVKAMGELVQVRLMAYPAEDRVFAAFSDDQGRLFAATYDLGKGWVAANSGAPVATDLASATDTRPFSVHINQ